MKEERTLSFGKYKGQEIKYIILTHIGYIMWCFENIGWFKLTDEEQALYDAVAIMIKKEGLPMTFPVELMYKHIKSREAFELLETPFISFDGYTSFRESEKDNPICKSVEKYITSNTHRSITSGGFSTGDLGGLIHSMDKDIEAARMSGWAEEDIFGGWGSMTDYKD